MSAVFDPRSIPAFFDECDFRGELQPVGRLRGNGLSPGFIGIFKRSRDLLTGSQPRLATRL
jgi:hypothetical protein